MKTCREVFARSFQPVATAGVFAVWWFLPWREDAPLETAAAVLIVANLAIYALEHVLADVDRWSTTSTDRRIDAFYLTMRIIVLGPLFQVGLLLTLEPYLDGALPLWPDAAPLPVRIALALFLGDLIPFCVHHAMHRFPSLWRYHATHHVQTKLNSARWASGHPLEYAIMNLPVLIVIILLGPAFMDVAGALIIGRMTVVLAHSNLPLRTSAIYGSIFTTPAHHRRHHSRAASNANFGDVLIVLDRLVGSFDSRTTNDVGVGAANKLTLREQLVLPWRMAAIKPAATFDTRETVIDLRDPSPLRKRRGA